MLVELINKACTDKLWSDEDIATYEEQKNNKYLFNFLSDEAKATLVTLAMADKANIMTNKIFNGAIEGRFAKQLKEYITKNNILMIIFSYLFSIYTYK